MENQTNVVSDFNEMVAREQKRLKEKNASDSISAIDDLYNELLKKGLIKKRGYTLRGIEDIHLWRGPKLNGYK
ncbi:MAG TPA: hypothetical protein VIM79_26665 [Niastella sp.]